MTDLSEFGEIKEPSEAAEPILSRAVRDALMAWLTEIWSEQDLIAVGLKARKRAVFDGPPGVGKTTLAHHLAARLGLPMLVVKAECLVDMYLGSTARNIGALFDAAKKREKKNPVFVFIDEFDGIAPKRMAAQQGAEREQNSYINTLLQRIEQHEGFIIAATNFAAQIDPAAWRRFDMHITLELPGQFERERIMERYLAPYGMPARSMRLLGEALETASPALMRQLAEGLKRQLVLGSKLGWDMSREACIGRLLATIHPHADVGKPRLWSRGAADAAVAALPWPLPLAKDVAAGKTPEPETENTGVIPINRPKERRS